MPETKPRRHSHPVHIRLTDEEWTLLSEASTAMGLTQIGLIRLMVRNAAFLTVSIPPESARLASREAGAQP
jgi:hypothetical protein